MRATHDTSAHQIGEVGPIQSKTMKGHTVSDDILPTQRIYNLWNCGLSTLKRSKYIRLCSRRIVRLTYQRDNHYSVIRRVVAAVNVGRLHTKHLCDLSVGR